jgi:hypothetical protein
LFDENIIFLSARMCKYILATTLRMTLQHLYSIKR